MLSLYNIRFRGSPFHGLIKIEFLPKYSFGKNKAVKEKFLF